VQVPRTDLDGARGDESVAIDIDEAGYDAAAGPP
jgi:hypothetical protein